MKRTNVADEFARLQRESQRAVELWGRLMAEAGEAGPKGPPATICTRGPTSTSGTVFTQLLKIAGDGTVPDRGKRGGGVGNGEFTRSGDEPRLTPRQAQILELAASGLSDKEIARRLHVTHRTVRTHFEKLFQDRGFRSRSQALA